MYSGKGLELRWEAVDVGDVTFVSLAKEKDAALGSAQPCRRLNQCPQHGVEIERRAADHLEHIGGRGLLLQRFLGLIEEARVLNGDDGLAGKIFNERNLLVGEWPHFLTIDCNRSDQCSFLEHGYAQKRPCTAGFDEGNHS